MHGSRELELALVNSGFELANDGRGEFDRTRRRAGSRSGLPHR